ncbi:MAG: HAD family phosphatase [Candidatus Tokpelaia sp.]|nr:MAG: HAD family phosphatase [Candidatus Tokpelaia sp.]KAA6207223.1 MAG: HAD family phosphatase [Candidatus Tokpelaia sp.]
MAKIKLVIFDCDGVLVDSEYLAAQIHAELLTQAGFPTTEEDIIEHYTGLSFAEILKIKEKTGDRAVSAVLLDKADQIFRKRMKKDLAAITGVRDCVATIREQMHLPYCICSNSASANIKAMLEQVKLYDLFRGRIFSAPEAGSKKPKPAPDIYLFAAEKAGLDPKQCVVLEDSVPGAKAAVAAGMRVVGFTGGRHARARLSGDLMETGVETTIARQSDFPATIRALDKFQE